jgi:anaerobic magnesium-protoporphyrin IX monomethyl ester cyclase
MRIVLLEHPRSPSEVHFNDIANTPLWSCLMTGYAGSSLQEAGFDVSLIDATCLSFEHAIRLIIDSPAELLAIHAVYFWEKTTELFEMLSALKTKGYGGSICLFGFFATLSWRDMLERVPEIDYVVVGEPEDTLVELARCLQAGSPAQGAGLAARVAGEATLYGLRTPIVPLDRLPFPLRPSLEVDDTVSVLASRGCYNGCSFCLIPTLDGGEAVWRRRSAANVAAEVAGLAGHGKRALYFVDPNFIGPGKVGKDGALDLAHALSGLAITFGMETRANDITAPLMRSLRDAGLTSLLLGIESGCPRVLQRLGKRTTVAQNEQAIAAVRDVGIEPEIGFIMFEPASTLDDVSENLTFLERNRLLDRLGRTANLLYHYHIAFKGTPGYRLALERGLLAPAGPYGFEGRLLFEDRRIGWLAQIMRSVCQFILREMGKPRSRIHWSADVVGESASQAVNDHLVEIFKRMLATAAGLQSEPKAAWSERLVSRTLAELEQTLSAVDARGGRQ